MKKNSGIDTVVGLFMICVFAACLLFALAAGVRIYKDVSAVMEEQYTSRTAMSYLTTRLHQSDAAGAVELGELAGTPAIVIHRSVDGEDYVTFVYCHEGYITELFCPASESLLPSDGLRVVPALSLELSLEGDLMRIDCETDGGAETAYVALRCHEGGEAA